MTAAPGEAKGTTVLSCDADVGTAKCDSTAAFDGGVRAARKAAAATGDWKTAMMPNLLSGSHLIDLCVWHLDW